MQQRETKEVIIITWKSGLKQVFEKTQLTYDMIVFEYEDIEEMEYSEIVTVKEEPKQEPKLEEVARLALEVCNALDQDCAIDRLSEETQQAYQELCDYRAGANQ